MSFSFKKMWLLLILIFLFTSTLQAQRVKSLDEYFTDVEKSAKKVGYALDSIRDFMDEAYKPDLFMPTTFLGLEPKWYKRTNGFITTEHPTSVHNKSERKIRHLTLGCDGFSGYGSCKTGSSNTIIYLKMYSIYEKDSYLNLRKEKEILKKNISKRNIKSAMNILFQHSKKINTIMEENFFSKIRNLEEDIVYLNEGKAFNLKSSRDIRIAFNTYKVYFRIKSRSIHEHYSLKEDFRSILEEYVKKGFCKKIVKSDNIKYESLKNTGKYKSSITYRKDIGTSHIEDGIWTVGVASDQANNDRRNIFNRTEQAFRELKKITKSYYDVVVNEIIKKYKDTEPRYDNNQKFESEF